MFFRKFTIVLLILAAMASLTFPHRLLAQPTLRQRVDEQVQPYLDEKIAVGMTVGIYQRGQSHAFGFGSTGRPEGSVPDGKTVYEIGSITKVFTGVLLADAVNRKLIDLDQPVQDLLPEGTSIPSKDGHPVLVRHLATHTSGLPRLPANMAPADAENPYADYSQEQLFQFLNQCQLSRAPGEASEYSNFAVGLLGQLLANQSKGSYGTLLKQRIAQPLAMNDSSIELTDSQRPRLAQPHDAAGNPVKNWDFQALVGAGGIRSTVDDMLLFAKANIAPPKSEMGDALELAWKIQQPPLTKDAFAMGLGWHIARDGSTRWHNGQTGGYHSMILVNRELDTAVVVLANSASMEIDRLAEDLMRLVAGATVKPRTFEETKKVAPEIMRRYVGRYELVPGFVLTVSVVGDRLMVGATGQPAAEVFAKTDTEWFYKVVKATITFKPDDQGQCQELELFQNGARHVAKRIE